MQFITQKSENNSGEEVRKSIGDGEINREKWTPLHYAAEKGSIIVLHDLINRGAGVDPTDTLDKTPLMIALENKNSLAARSLIESRADIEMKDLSGKTPLMYASKTDSLEIC